MKRRTPILLLCTLVLASLNACTYDYFLNSADTHLQRARLKSNYMVKRESDWIVHPRTAVTLARPIHIQSKIMPRNLTFLYQSLDLSLKQAFPSYSTHLNTVTLDQALSLAKVDKSELLFWPALVSTENNLNTERELREGPDLSDSSRYGPDRVVFQVLIYEVRTGRLLDLASVHSRSRMFAPNDSTPIDLYQDAAMRYTQVITGKQAS